MPSTYRTRSREGGGGQEGVFWLRSANYIADRKVIPRSFKEVCEDTHGYKSQDNFFVHSRWDETAGSVTSHSTANWRYDGYPIYHGSPYMMHYHSIPNSLDPTKIQALTNPNRPVVDIPVFIAELGDLPKLVKLGGESLLGKAASGNLAWQFGWKPLLDDLSKMMDFANHVAKKQDALRRLHSKGGLKRRLSPKSTSKTEVLTNATLFASPIMSTVRGTQTWTTEKTEWATARWKPTTTAPVSDPSHYVSAVRLALGLDLTMSTLWEALPWSWMADWFGNVGDYLMASRNTVPVKCVSCCHMATTKTTDSWIVTSNPDGASITPPRRSFTSKTRYPSTALTLTADIPFLDLSRLSILGSLAVLRAERR